MGQEYLGVVRDGSGDPRGGQGRVVGPSGRSGTGQVTLAEDQDGSWDRRGGLGRVGGPSGKFGTDRGMLEKVYDGSGNLGEVQEMSRDPR